MISEEVPLNSLVIDNCGKFVLTNISRQMLQFDSRLGFNEFLISLQLIFNM